MDSRHAPPISLDTRPLTEPVDRTAVSAFARQLRAEGRAPAVAITTGVIGFVVALVFIVVFGGSLAVRAVEAFVLSRAGGILPLLVPLIFLTVIIVIGVIVVRSFLTRRTRWYRLDRFAQANGMTFVPQLKAPRLPGMIFSVGSERVATDLVRGQRPRFTEIANYSYATGSGKERTTHSWGYVAVRLRTPLPHIVLDAVGNNGLFSSNLPASFRRDQRLSLEGDFDRYFALYCPAGYERDALYLFTPDIMARFIDKAAALDVEIVDDWLFLYAKRDFSTLDPATWQWLFSVVGALRDKFDQWERWRDDRLSHAPAAPHVDAAAAASAAPPAPATLLRPPPGVARPGQRLARRAPVVAFIALGLFVVIWLLTQAGVLSQFLSLLR